MDDATMKFGLLMESAQAHQKLAETHLERLRAHTQDLDGVVRDEIRRTLIEELQMLTAESKRATEALRKIGRGAALRSGFWSIVVAVLCTAIPAALMRWVLPSGSEIAALRERRDELSASIAALEQHGGRVVWRHCGETFRLCVRVDRKAPVYGESADYYVVAGY
jgi:predicted phage gp36 major capsid-like protein